MLIWYAAFKSTLAIEKPWLPKMNPKAAKIKEKAKKNFCFDWYWASNFNRYGNIDLFFFKDFYVGHSSHTAQNDQKMKGFDYPKSDEKYKLSKSGFTFSKPDSGRLSAKTWICVFPEKSLVDKTLKAEV